MYGVIVILHCSYCNNSSDRPLKSATSSHDGDGFSGLHGAWQPATARTDGPVPRGLLRAEKAEVGRSVVVPEPRPALTGPEGSREHHVTISTEE